MYEPFELPVDYQGKELLFPAQLVQAGFVHRFKVDVYGEEVTYEPDEEGVYRALIAPDQMTKEITPELLKAIAETIEAIT